jgi:hypothetical protein
MTHTFQREALFLEVWSTPMTALAKKYGLSDSGIRKICKAMEIPTPIAGHWAKAAVGKAPKPPKLPESAQTTVFQFDPSTKSATALSVRQEDDAWLNERLRAEHFPSNLINVEQVPIKWHEAVVPLKIWLEGCASKYQKALKDKERADKAPARKSASFPNFSHWDIHSNEPILGSTHHPMVMRVSVGTYQRALALLNALARAAEARGFKVSVLKNKERLRFSIESTDIDIAITERLEESFIRVRSSWNSEERTEKKKIPTGRLRLNLGPSYRTVQISENSSCPLEEELHRVFEYAYRQVIRSREDARASEVEKQKTEIRRLAFEVAERQRKDRELKLAEEERRRKELVSQSDGWNLAMQIRKYVEAVDFRVQAERACKATLTGPYTEWRAWALATADSYDPIENMVSRFLEKIE